MNKTPKQKKTSRKEPSQPDVLEKPTESRISVDLAPEELSQPKPQAPTETDVSIRAAADEPLRPWIEVLAPWDPNCDDPASCPYDIPQKDGQGGVGVVVARVHAYRAAPEIQLGDVRWEYNFVEEGANNLKWIGADAIPRDAGDWEVTRSIEFPYNVEEKPYQLWMWVFNRWDSGRIHRRRYVTYRDRTPPMFEIVSPKNNAQVPPGELAVRGWAEDRQSEVAAVEWSLDGDPTYKQATITPGRRVDWEFKISNLSPGTHTIVLRFRDKKGNLTARDAASVITVTATGAYKPKDDLASLRAYLEDLLDYAKNHVTIPNIEKEKLTETLTNLFYQPFEQLKDIPVPLGSSQPVNQLRAAIEVLRKYPVVTKERPSSHIQPIAHWKCDESSGSKLNDASTYGHHGTLFNGPVWASGKLGGALSFDGVDDYVQIPNAPILEVGKNDADFSVTFWMYLRQGFTGKWRSIMHKGNENLQRTFALWMHLNDNRMTYRISTTANSNDGGDSIGQIPLNTWTHIAYVKAGFRLKLYINSKLDSEVMLAGASVSNNGPLYLGKDPWTPTGMNGNLDDIRIYNLALSDESIQAVAAGSVPSERPSSPVRLIAHWKFDEGQGDKARDATGNEHTGTLQGATWSAGRTGSAVSFDGVDDFVKVVDLEPLVMTRALTIGAWIYPKGPGTPGQGGIIVCKEANYALARSPDGSIQWASYGKSGWDWIKTGYIAPLEKWTHITVVYERGTIRTYADGNLVDTYVGAGDVGLANLQDLRIGARLDTGRQGATLQHFHGLLDDVRFYDGALSDNDVATLAYPRTEASYLLAAYQALLNRIGTSDEEIRLARRADREVRAALASRLGITLDPGNDQLEQLLLPADQITEKKLEELFGLADTKRDPLKDVQEPLLLKWRRDHLEALWLEQDNPANSQSEAPLPIIDPDLIGWDDLLLAEKDNPAFDLWQERSKELTEAFTSLGKQPKTLEGFNTNVNNTLRPDTPEGKESVAYLLELEQRQKAGTDIEPDLKKLHLTRPAFTRLLRVQRLAEEKAVRDADWDDVYHILVQAGKQRSYPVWRGKEKEKQIALTPRLFQISETIPQLPPWRATWRARLNWQDTLQARIDQRQTTEDALLVAVSAVEEQTLPVLRDALIARLADTLAISPSDTADWIVHRLLVDVKTNASQRTTRLIQAIETVQGVLFALRAGQLAENHPAVSWRLMAPDPENPEKHFDEEWQWMGNYSTWRAAMFVFYFPETVLLPSLREPYDASQPFDPLHRTTQFEALLKELRKRPRLTPDQARIEASTYLNNLLDDNRLKDTSPNPMPKKLRDAIEATRPSSKEAPTFLTDHHTDETLGKLRQLCREIVAPYGHQSIPNYIQEIFYGVPLQLAWQLQKSGAYLATLDWFQTVYAYNLPFGMRKIYHGLERETNGAPELYRSDHWLTEGLNPHDLAARRSGSNPHTRYTLMSLARCLMDFADSEFTRDTAESLARARALYLTTQRLLFSPDIATPTLIPEDATLLPNPLLDLLQLRVNVQLTKMRQGRNIAGMKRQVELPVSLPPGVNDLPMIGAGGQLIIPGAPQPTFRPTPYYFRVLLERSKQLVNIAQQIEAAYLAALEKRDAENYNLLKANNDLQLAMMGEELQNRRVNEAQTGVGLANAQRQRAVVMSEKYKMLSSIGLSAFEQQMISSYQEAMNYIRQAGGAGAEAATLGGLAAWHNAEAAAASSFLPVSGGFGGFSASPIPNEAARRHYHAAGAAAMGSAAAQAQAAIYSANAQVAQAQASISGIRASAEWRQREFETQAAIAEQDIAIGEAQIGVAQAHVGVAEQERRIAQTQVTQAQAVADFLAKKFTNAELYEWMSGVLGEVYSYFLQQATAMAQLAENQLAFERQDTPPRLIRADYWEVPSDTGSLTTTDQKAPDRKGLTGSARLLQDIHTLDQYAFETDKRKLNLSQTFSLARMAPYDFEQFRQTGVLTFATTMSLFDRDFPGHFLRLIRGVRLSVIALIPPHHGIRASLIASGISRVVTGGDVFQQVVVRRDPELVALTSPISATGVFEMDVQSEMLRPFESMGVDTFWQFEMPRAANPFDFRTIADVLITIDYTALNSFDYRQQVIKLLNPKLSGERSFIFTSQFADAWYDLHNPEQSATPMTVKFKTWREDFPPNLDDLKIEQVLLFFSRFVDESAGEKPTEVEVSKFLFTPKDKKEAVGFDGTKDKITIATIDGVISTRQGSGSTLSLMQDKSPAGEWELSFNFNDPVKDKEIRNRFKNEEIDDILLVITYGGRTPEWPA